MVCRASGRPELLAVPANMTHFFQPLDLSAAKIYSTSVQQQLQSGKAAEVGECHKTTSCTVACTLQVLLMAEILF